MRAAARDHARPHRALSQGDRVLEASASIEVSDLVFRYTPNGADVLRGISLRIEAGEFVALIGQNGAGKTTLAKHFNGLLKPRSGSVRVMGRDTRTAPVADMARTVGYVYQNPDHQIFAQRVRAEAAFGPRNLGLSPAEVERRVDAALELVGLREHADEFAFSLGRGQRQKLAVASVLAMEPRVLVIDEPTTGLDQAGARGILELLSRWNAEGRTIIAITHDMALVAERIPRTIVVSDGLILADGPTREVLSDAPLLRQAFLRPPQVTRVAQQLAEFGIRPDTLTVSELLAQIREPEAIA
jgi:cobalt transport protein ATP-binding subunit